MFSGPFNQAPAGLSYEERPPSIFPAQHACILIDNILLFTCFFSHSPQDRPCNPLLCIHLLSMGLVSRGCSSRSLLISPQSIFSSLLPPAFLALPSSSFVVILPFLVLSKTRTAIGILSLLIACFFVCLFNFKYLTRQIHWALNTTYRHHPWSQ